MRAVVLGGTGAIGKHVVTQLLERNAWDTVITVGRRKVVESGDEHGDKLQQVVVDMDQLATAAEDAFKGADAVFCALGTTRAVAGSAEVFKKVDRDYVAASAQLAKAAGVRYYGLVTAVGANANIWASDFVLFHPLLYTRTKGEAEQAVLAQKIPHTSIFRPGLLNRGGDARGVEKAMAVLARGILVEDVARGMILDAERRLGQGAGGEGWVAYEMKALQQAAAAGKAPEGKLQVFPAVAAEGETVSSASSTPAAAAATSVAGQ